MTNGTGLDRDGCFLREGALDRVSAPFAPVVAELGARIGEHFGPGRLHSSYLYGSVPRGTAVPGSPTSTCCSRCGTSPPTPTGAAARAVEDRASTPPSPRSTASGSCCSAWTAC